MALGSTPLPEAPLRLPWPPRPFKIYKRARLFAFSKGDALPEAPSGLHLTPPARPSKYQFIAGLVAISKSWHPRGRDSPWLPPPFRSLILKIYKKTQAVCVFCGSTPLPEAPPGLPWTPRSRKCIRRIRRFACSEGRPIVGHTFSFRFGGAATTTTVKISCVLFVFLGLGVFWRFCYFL